MRLEIDLGNIAIFISFGLPCSTTAFPLVVVVPRRRPAALGFTGILLPLRNLPLWSFLETVPQNTQPKRWRALDNHALTNPPDFVNNLYRLKNVFIASVTIGVSLIHSVMSSENS